MNWKRERPGVYTAGPYLVEQLAVGGWYASGPGVDEPTDRKDHAQVACERYALARIEGRERTCPAFLGDAVTLWTRGGAGVRQTTGRIHSVFPNATENGKGPLYSIHLARGRKVCMYRDEFQVVLP
jgi:hypothetical protein